MSNRIISMHRPKVYDEEAIINKLKEGDEASFKCLFDRYRNELFTYCLRITKERSLAEEIVQDVFMIIWQKRDEVQSQLPIRPYLYTIAQNLSFNFLKKAANDSKMKRQVFYESQKEFRQDWLVDFKDTKKLIEQAITQMPSKQRLIFSLSRMESKSHEEIARELQISKNTVKDQIFKALKAIRHYLQTHQLLLLFLLPIVSPIQPSGLLLVIIR